MQRQNIRIALAIFMDWAARRVTGTNIPPAKIAGVPYPEKIPYIEGQALPEIKNKNLVTPSGYYYKNPTCIPPEIYAVGLLPISNNSFT